MYYNNMETRDPVLPSSCTAVFDVFESCTMTCLHVSWHFIHVQLLFYAFFYFYQCNEYNYIFQYKCSVCGKCLSKFSSLLKLKLVIQHQKSIWGDFLHRLLKVETMLHLGAPSGIQTLPVFASLFGLLLTCITEYAFLKIQYISKWCHYAVFSSWCFSSSVPLAFCIPVWCFSRCVSPGLIEHLVVYAVHHMQYIL